MHSDKSRAPGVQAFRRAVLFSLILVLGLGAVAAQESAATFRGRVANAAGEPVVGYRVVFRVVDRVEVYLSQPTDEAGNYLVRVPAGASYLPVALIAPRGRRIALEDVPAIDAPAGGVVEVPLQLPGKTPTGAPATVALGVDRLFLNFVEDVPELERLHVETDIGFTDLDSGEAVQSTFVADYRPEERPLTIGMRLGLAGVDFAGPRADRAGTTDLELWARYRLPKPVLRKGSLAVGVLMTLPTGETDTGLSADAIRGKLFAAARFPARRLTWAFHAGVRFNEDGEVLGVAREGRTALAASVAAVVPLDERMGLVLELAHEGERFEGMDPDTRLLVGTNWRAFRHGAVRLAVAAGLSDGAPDAQLVVGYAFDF